jgi:hypothetical protein
MILVTDDFNRADGGLGANWSTTDSGAAPGIVSNTVQNTGFATTSHAEAIYTPIPFNDDQYAQITINTINTDVNHYVGVISRGTVNASGTEYRSYVLGPLGASASLHIGKLVAGVFTDLANVTLTIATGDKLRLECRTSQITAFVNGVQKLQVIDRSVTGGLPGIVIGSGTAAADAIGDNFEAGDFYIPPPKQRIFHQSKTLYFI